MPRAVRQPRVQLVSLGCAKNTVDSEEMLGVLMRDGFELGRKGGSADVVVVNTCGFLQAAREESCDAIRRALDDKRRGRVGKVVVTGCMAQRYAAELRDEWPDVDAVLGAGRHGRILESVKTVLGQSGRVVDTPPKPRHEWLDNPVRVVSTSPWSAYLKIGEGCAHECTFCTIPSIRGPHVSKPLELAVAEATALAAGGVKELNLIAQDTTQYGLDLPDRPRLPDLLTALSEVEGLRWLRVLYAFPGRMDADLIACVSDMPKVCAYVDIPLQHSHPVMLRAMRRPGGGEEYRGLVDRLRSAAPDVALRTTFIVGFPGETDAHFEHLLRFAADVQFDRVGAFAYSSEEGTPASLMPDQIPESVMQERLAALMGQQEGVSRARNQRWLGRELEVLVESVDVAPASRMKRGVGRPSRNGGGPMPAGTAVGRSFRDAPEIDGQVRVTACSARPGDFILARIESALVHDLGGVQVTSSGLPDFGHAPVAGASRPGGSQ